MNKHYQGLVFSLFACFMLSLPFCPPVDIVTPDKEIFTYAGELLHKGLIPYRDLFDHKPPLIYFFNYAGIFLGGPWAFWLLNILLALGTTGLLYRCCQNHRIRWPWLLPLLFNLMLRDFLVSKGMGMTREYTTCFLVLFFCVLMGRNRYRHYIAGALAGLIFFTQQEQALLLIPLSIYFLASKDPRPPTHRLLQMAGGFLTVLLPIAGFFALHGALGDLWRDAFQFNLRVYITEKKSLGDHFRTIKHVLDAGNYEFPFMIAFCLGLTALISQTKRKGLILAAFIALLLTFIPELMGGRTKGASDNFTFFYYFVPLAATVPILLFAVLAGGMIPETAQIRLPVALLLCTSLLYTSLQHAANLTLRRRDPALNTPELSYLRQHKPANYQLYVVFNDDALVAYNEFHILAPSPWLYQHFWTWYPDWDGDGSILHMIGDDLLRHRTTYLLMDPGAPATIRNPANAAWWLNFIQKYYQPVPLSGTGKSALWQLKDN